jgi:hypothetical protein
MIAVLAEGRGGVSLDGVPRPWFGRWYVLEGDVLGRAALDYFSREVPREEPGRIRWERIGQRLR